MTTRIILVTRRLFSLFFFIPPLTTTPLPLLAIATPSFGPLEQVNQVTVFALNQMLKTDLEIVPCFGKWTKYRYFTDIEFSILYHTMNQKI